MKCQCDCLCVTKNDHFLKGVSVCQSVKFTLTLFLLLQGSITCASLLPRPAEAPELMDCRYGLHPKTNKIARAFQLHPQIILSSLSRVVFLSVCLLGFI